MIVGLGIDIVSLKRIADIYDRFGMRFLQKFMTPGEIAAMPVSHVSYVSGRFAAKEACAKALGTGFADGIGPCQMEVLTTASGAPRLFLHTEAKARAAAIGALRWHISISHEREMAVATVILEGNDDDGKK